MPAGFLRRAGLFFLVLALVLVVGLGCDEQRTSSAIPVTDQPNGEGRFTVESQGSFRAGYDNHRRELLIVTDIVTGRKYLGITGVGVTELFTESDGNSSHTIEE